MARRGGRHDNGNVVVAVEACDLFDQVGRQRQIGTPRGGSHREDVIHRTFDEAADRRQQLSDTLGAVSDAGQTLGLTGTARARRIWRQGAFVVALIVTLGFVAVPLSVLAGIIEK